MTRKLYLSLLLVLSFALTNSVIAQDKKKSDTATSVSGPGSAYYTTGKSKQMWELGIHGGHVFMAGDVVPTFAVVLTTHSLGDWMLVTNNSKDLAHVHKAMVTFKTTAY